MLSEWSVGQGRSLMPCLDAVSEAHPEDRSRRAGRDCSSRSCGVGRWSRRLARKLRAPSGTVSGQSLQKPRARFPPGSRCGLRVARIFHHSPHARLFTVFRSAHTAGKIATKSTCRSRASRARSGNPVVKVHLTFLPPRTVAQPRPSEHASARAASPGPRGCGRCAAGYRRCARSPCLRGINRREKVQAAESDGAALKAYCWPVAPPRGAD